jgi:hypothetical protein
MPIEQIHKSRLRKNLLTLALIFGWVAFIWIISMIKFSNGG